MLTFSHDVTALSDCQTDRTVNDPDQRQPERKWPFERLANLDAHARGVTVRLPQTLRFDGLPMFMKLDSMAHRVWSHLADHPGQRMTTRELTRIVGCYEVNTLSTIINKWVARGVIHRAKGVDRSSFYWVEA